MNANNVSSAMEEAIKETKRRREIQDKFNKEHNIVPKSINKEIIEPIRVITQSKENKKDNGKLTRSEIEKEIKKLTNLMKEVAKDLDFEKDALLRDQLFELKSQL